jgi:hypothetical protein
MNSCGRQPDSLNARFLRLGAAPKGGGADRRPIVRAQGMQGKRPHCNGDRVGQPLRHPKHGGAAIGAKVKADRKPGIGAPFVGSKISFRLDVLASEKCGYAIGAAGSPLAIQTMAEGNPEGIAGTGNAKISTGAGRGSGGHELSPQSVQYCKMPHPGRRTVNFVETAMPATVVRCHATRAHARRCEVSQQACIPSVVESQLNATRSGRKRCHPASSLYSLSTGQRARESTS